MPKFSKIDERSKLFTKLIAGEAELRSMSQISSTFDPFRLTECPRRLVYRITGVNCSISTLYMDYQNELAMKEKWFRIFTDCKKIKFLEKDAVVADAKYNITGKINAVISFDDDIYITQIKSVCDEDLKNIKQKGALKKDVVESVLYLWLLEVKDGLIIYDTNKGGYLTFHIEPYQPIIKSVKSKCLEMMRHKMEGSLPERPYKNCSSNECNICEFLHLCWQ